MSPLSFHITEWQFGLNPNNFLDQANYHHVKSYTFKYLTFAQIGYKISCDRLSRGYCSSASGFLDPFGFERFRGLVGLLTTRILCCYLICRGCRSEGTLCWNLSLLSLPDLGCFRDGIIGKFAAMIGLVARLLGLLCRCRDFRGYSEYSWYRCKLQIRFLCMTSEQSSVGLEAVKLWEATFACSYCEHLWMLSTSWR